jgi:hypothetical protein
MAIPAINPIIARVVLVAELDWLLPGIPSLGCI